MRLTDYPAAGRLLGADGATKPSAWEPEEPERARGQGQVGECRSPNASRQTGASDLRSPLREALPLEPRVSRLHSWTLASPYPRALLKGRGALLCRTSPLLDPGIPSFLEKSNRNFPVESHLPGERGSLWMVTAKPTAPSRQASAPRVLQGCQATTSSWYFESGSSHARPSKGWLCVFTPGVGEWGGVKPKGPRSRCQGLGRQRGGAWPPASPPHPNMQGRGGAPSWPGGISATLS